MKILFYLGKGDSSLGGAYNYAVELLKIIENDNDITNIILLVSKHNANFFKENSGRNVKVIEDKRYSSKYLQARFHFASILYDLSELSGMYKRNGRVLYMLAELLNPYRRLFRRYKFDILHVPFQISPIYSLKVPVIITMHDLQEFHFPENFTPTQRIYRSIKYKTALEKADHIVSSFKHINRDIRKYFNIERNKMSVYPINFWGQNLVSIKSTCFEVLKKKYLIGDTYIFYPAQTWPHKNHITLLKAIHLLNSKNIKVNLVCTGKLSDYYNVEILPFIMEHDMTNQVKFLGIVSFEDLTALYRNCLFVVIPTLYEAGSGPLFEAIYLNKAVICSSITSLPETMANDEFIFNPYEVENIADKIELMLTNRDFYLKNMLHIKNRSSFLKENHVSISNIYKKVLSGQ